MRSITVGGLAALATLFGFLLLQIDMPQVPPPLKAFAPRPPEPQVPAYPIQDTANLPTGAGGTAVDWLSAESVDDFRQAVAEVHRGLGPLLRAPGETAVGATTDFAALASTYQSQVQVIRPVGQATYTVTIPHALNFAYSQAIAPFLKLHVATRGVVSTTQLLGLASKAQVNASPWGYTQNAVSKGTVQINGQSTSLTNKGQIATTLIETISFKWTPDFAVALWGPLDTGLVDPSIAVRYILAVRVVNRGTVAFQAGTLTLEVRRTDYGTNPATVGAWTQVPNSAPPLGWSLSTPASFPRSDNSAIQAQDFQCSTLSLSQVPGEFEANNTTSAGFNLQPGQETELWWCLDPANTGLFEAWDFRVGTTSTTGAVAAEFPYPFSGHMVRFN